MEGVGAGLDLTFAVGLQTMMPRSILQGDAWRPKSFARLELLCMEQKPTAGRVPGLSSLTNSFMRARVFVEYHSICSFKNCSCLLPFFKDNDALPPPPLHPPLCWRASTTTTSAASPTMALHAKKKPL